MTHKEKILQFVEALNITKTKFCNKCGFSNGFLDSKGAIGSDKLAIILENFRNLNVNWLLFDEGEMIKKEESVHASIPSLNENSKEHGKNYRDMYYDSLVKYQNLNEKYLRLKDAFESLKKDDKQLSVKP